MATKLYTAEEVATLLGVELDTLYRYARSGKIRGVKIGKLWRFPESDVDAFLQARRYVSSRLPAGSALLLTEILERVARASSSCGGVVAGGVRRSFSDIDRLAGRLAAALIESGVKPGDRVACLLPNCTEFLVTCFAIWKARAVLVAEYIAIRPANLLHILRDAKPTALVIDNGVAERIEEMRQGLDGVRVAFIKDRTFAFSGQEDLVVESLDAVLESPAYDNRPLPTGAKPDDLVSIGYTSGSTGIPKGVMQTHDSTLAGAEFTRDYHNVAPTDSIVIPLPLHHGLAFRQLLAYVMADATIIIASDIYQALKLLRDHRPTALVLVPAGANLVIDHFAPVLQQADGHLRYIEVGSAAIAPERLGRLRNLLPTTQIHLPYGLTEARVGFLERGGEGVFNRIAAVAAGLFLTVIDSDGRPAANGDIGEIVLKGRGLMKGYWGQTKEQLDSLARDGFRTGDMAQLSKTGDVQLLGRVDDMLKVGGRKVNPLEVEMAMNRHPGVAEAAVAGVPDPKGIFELELHAFVVAKKDADLNEDDLLEHCRRHVEPYKLPARIHFRNSLPKSAVGKVLRSELATERAAG